MIKRLIVFGGLALLFFVGTIAVALLISGNLNKEAVARLTGGPESAPGPVEEAPLTPDPLAELAQQLRQREETLDRREDELEERAAQLEAQRQDLVKLRNELNQIQDQINESLATADEQDQQNLQEIANSLIRMRSENAAEILMEWEPVKVAQVLRLMKEKDRGEILDDMESDQASRALEALRNQQL